MATKKKKERKRKFVIWLHNHTDRRDDEWVSVWAHSPKEASNMEIQFDTYRFSRGGVMTAAEFRKQMGIYP